MTTTQSCYKTQTTTISITFDPLLDIYVWQINFGNMLKLRNNLPYTSLHTISCTDELIYV